MKLNTGEMFQLIWVKDHCMGTVIERVCEKCPFYEGYCHFYSYLQTQLISKVEEEKKPCLNTCNICNNGGYCGTK